MKAPRRRDPRDDAANLANDTRAVLGLAPYRLPSAIVAVVEEEAPEPYVHRHHGLIDTCCGEASSKRSRRRARAMRECMRGLSAAWGGCCARNELQRNHSAFRQH